MRYYLRHQVCVESCDCILLFVIGSGHEGSLRKLMTTTALAAESLGKGLQAVAAIERPVIAPAVA